MRTEDIEMRRQPERQAGLRDLIRDCPGGILVEIGSWMGESAAIFASSGKFSAIYCVDPWDLGIYDNRAVKPGFYKNRPDMRVVESRFDEVAARYPEITKLKMTSEQALTRVPGMVDMVYLDGLHDYDGVRDDMRMWAGRIRPGGWLTGHDYHKNFPGVIQAVDEIWGAPALYQDTSWAIRIGAGGC
jgi:hypothetical protein